MKKALKWMVGTMAVLLLLPFVLIALLYLPPVQNWAAGKIASLLSEKTGMEISVGQVNLQWPLDLRLDDFLAVHAGDTLADVGTLVADVRLLPLLDKRVVVDELSLQRSYINTNGFISDLQVRGSIGELRLSIRGIDLGRETVEVNGALLADASLDISLSDTSAVDTTASNVRWRIAADSLTVRRTSLSVHMPGDTTHISSYLGLAVARDADIDIGNAIYRVAGFNLHDGSLSPERSLADEPRGFMLAGVRLGVDSISYSPQGTSFYIREASLREQLSGLQLTELHGGVLLDSAFSHVRMPGLTLRTADSDVEAEVDMDFSVLDSLNPGRAHIRLNAQIGKQELMNIVAKQTVLPRLFWRGYPNSPLTVRGSVDGNMEQMTLTGLDLQLPTAFYLNVDGSVHNVSDPSHLQADLNVRGETRRMDFIAALLPDAGLRLPPMTMSGKLNADGNSYAADLTARPGQGFARLAGSYNGSTQHYDADISVRQINVHDFLPRDSIYTLSADVKVKGCGLDMLSPRTTLTAEATVGRLQYGSWDISDVRAEASLSNGRLLAAVSGQNTLFDGKVDISAQLDKKRVEGTIGTDLQLIDLYRMRIVDKPLTIGAKGTVSLATDMKDSHKVRGRLGSLYIKDETNTYHPEDLGVYLFTDRDTTVVRVQSGNLIVKLDAADGYERLLSSFVALGDSAVAQYRNKVIDQQAIRRLLPTMKLYVSSGRDNPVAAILRSNKIDFKDLKADFTTSPETGVNGYAYLYSLNYDSTLIDTVSLTLAQKGDRLTYQARLKNNKRNPQMVFNALVDGHFHEHGALAGLRYYDDKNRLGVRIGATAEMEEGGIRFKLMPDRPTLGYKEFNLNKDNYVFLGNDKRIQAKVDLVADDKTGLKIYTDGADADGSDRQYLQDLTVSVNLFDLGELTAAMPFLPQVTGRLNGDFHVVLDHQENISVVSDMGIEQMTFEGSPIGNVSAELDYLMKDDDSHVIDARLMLGDEEFGQLSGTYRMAEGKGRLDAKFSMTRFPLALANGFIPDQLVGLEGYGEGELTISGRTDRPVINGEVYVEDAYLVSHPYGVRMRFDNDPVRIVNSKLLLENFGLYAYNDEPLLMQGSVDFSNTDRVTMDMQMKARNMLLVNSRQEPGSIAFGKAFVNFFARMQGPLEALTMRGRLDVLGSTDLTYMLLDSPLSTDNRLEELVKFTDFTDTTQTVVSRPVPTGLNVDLTVSVSQGAHVLCNLNSEQTNYLDLMGGGDLRMLYGSEGIRLSGRYTLSSGEMKYSLPIIPLKTFRIEDGSYVEFAGDPMNPRLNIKATERTKASVSEMGDVSRTVAFDCGVVITKTLNDMGLQFVIEAPEDQNVSGELATMSVEERGKIAVTMLTTGMYLADGNTNGFSMNSALSSFLENEINQIAGSALKTLDLQLGIDNTTDASGQMRTDYSFRFAKRFMNNRLKLQIGGKVSAGETEALGEQQSFFDNVTMEYRLNQEATQNLKLFYNQNVYDWLEGYTGEYGVGFVWRRKLDSLLKWSSDTAGSNAAVRTSDSRNTNGGSANSRNNDGRDSGREPSAQGKEGVKDEK